MPEDRKAQLKEKAKEELRLMAMIALYLGAFFAAFLTYRRLVSREFGVTSFRYGFAAIEALVIAKVILIGKAVGLGKNATGRALGFAVLRLSVLYALLVAVFAILEHTVEGLIHGKDLAASVAEVWSGGIYEVLARALVLFVAFIPFFAIWEIARSLGEGRLFEMFFGKGPRTAGG